MKRKIVYILLLFCMKIVAQNGFHFEGQSKKITLPFKVLNNLIIIPVQVNGVTLNFMVDTGVEESILFSLDDTDEIQFEKIEKIKIKGFGINESFDAYKSVKNNLKIKNFVDNNHTLYLVLDQDINISSQVGLPVNGILGYHFFKNNAVKINYSTKKITIYKDVLKSKINKKYSKLPVVLKQNKPFINTKTLFTNDSQFIQSNLLVDTGNSDALWIFKERNDSIQIPASSFEDYLGKGFGGDVFGKRARIASFKIASFTFMKPLISFPDSSNTKHIDSINDRLGSIGSEMLRRFTLIIDYPSSSIYLKKNENFSSPFNFNMSGIDIHHQGLQWIPEAYIDKPISNDNLLNANGDKLQNNLKYKFELKPIYVISNVRKDSPAFAAGLQKDDVIVKINYKNGYSFTLQEISDLLKSEEGKTIEIEVERKGKLLKFKFQLKSII